MCMNGLVIDSNVLTKEYQAQTLGNYKTHQESNGRQSYKNIDTEEYLYWALNKRWKVSAYFVFSLLILNIQTLLV